MSKLDWYIVFVTEYSGYDCSGHRVGHLVAAESPNQAVTLIPHDGIGDNEKPTCFWLGDLPDISRLRRPKILSMWYLDYLKEVKLQSTAPKSNVGDTNG